MSALKNASKEEIINALDQSKERVVVNIISDKHMSKAEEYYHKAGNTSTIIQALSPKECKRMNISHEKNRSLYDQAVARQFMITSLKHAQPARDSIEDTFRATPHSFCSRIKYPGKIKSSLKG